MTRLRHLLKILRGRREGPCPGRRSPSLPVPPVRRVSTGVSPGASTGASDGRGDVVPSHPATGATGITGAAGLPSVTATDRAGRPGHHAGGSNPNPYLGPSIEVRPNPYLDPSIEIRVGRDPLGPSTERVGPPARLIKGKPVRARASSDPAARDVWHDSELEGVHWTPALERAGLEWTYLGTWDAWFYALAMGRIEPPRSDRTLEGFPISRNGKTTYRPDYWLPQLGVYVEIKPTGRDIRAELWKPTAHARACRAGEWPGRDVVVITGKPTRAKLTHLTSR